MANLVLALAWACVTLAQEPPLQVSAWLVPWDQADPTGEGLACLSELDLFAYAFKRGGDLTLASPGLLDADARAPGRLVLPVIVNDVIDKHGRVQEKSPELLAALLNDGARVERHVAQILKTLPLDKIDGVEIDYERIPPGAWPPYETLIRRLAQELHGRGKRLHVDVEVRGLFGKDRGKDRLSELARWADLIKVMAYYQRGEWTNGMGPGSSVSWIEDAARRALAVVPAEKLSIALSLSGTDWELPDPRAASLRRVERLHFDRVLDLLARSPGEPRWSETEQAPFIDYEWKGRKHRLWYEDSRSLAAKVGALRRAGVRRVALWYAGKRHPDLNTSGLCPR